MPMSAPPQLPRSSWRRTRQVAALVSLCAAGCAPRPADSATPLPQGDAGPAATADDADFVVREARAFVDRSARALSASASTDAAPLPSEAVRSAVLHELCNWAGDGSPGTALEGG